MKAQPAGLRPRTLRSGLIALGILALALAAAGCKSPTSPSGGEADIIIVNDYGEAADLYMDGAFKFTIANKMTIEIDDVSLDEHVLTAKRTGTDIVIGSTTIDVTSKIDYSWTIDNPPDINVTNNSGIDVAVSMDGQYRFDLADDENRWIMDVPMGERYLKATRLSDGREVASTTIKIEENKDYAWTIEVIGLR